MTWSKAPRRKKIFFLSAGVLILAVVLFIIGTSNRPEANDPTVTNLELDGGGFNQLVDVLVQVDGTSTGAYVDVMPDDGDCKVSEAEAAQGILSETSDQSSSVIVSLPDNQQYVIQATAKDRAVSASQGVAINTTAAGCMKEVVAPNNGAPVTITIPAS